MVFEQPLGRTASDRQNSVRSHTFPAAGFFCVHVTSNAPALALAAAPSDSSEALLRSMAVRSDMHAFGLLADRYGTRLASFCARSTRSASTGEDLAHDVLVSLWDARARFAGGDADAWVFTHALNRCRREARRLGRWAGVLRRLGAGAPRSASGAAEQGLLAAQVSRQVQELPEGQRDALLLRYQAELDYRSIGLTLGCTAEAARARVCEGLRTLRRALEVES